MAKYREIRLSCNFLVGIEVRLRRAVILARCLRRASHARRVRTSVVADGIRMYCCSDLEECRSTGSLVTLVADDVVIRNFNPHRRKHYGHIHSPH